MEVQNRQRRYSSCWPFIPVSSISSPLERPTLAVSACEDPLRSASSLKSSCKPVGLARRRSTRTRTPPSHPDNASSKKTKHSSLAIQWNMNGYSNNLADLELLIAESTPVIIALQEIHRSDTKTMEKTLQGQYNWILKGGANIYQSAAIGIHRSTTYVDIIPNSDLIAVAARVESPFPITVVSIYIPTLDCKNIEQRLSNFLDQLLPPFLILGDFNAHHVSWGSRRNTEKGFQILRASEKANLRILNDGSPTFTRPLISSAIDISFASENLLGRLQWSISKDPMGSDHHPISIYCNFPTPKTTRRPRWKYELADWQLFQNTIEISPIEDDTPLEGLISTILTAASEAIPKTSPNAGRRALRWWSPETKTAIKLRRKALRKMKRIPKDHPNAEKIAADYCSKRNACRDIVRAAKRKSWDEFLNGISSDSSSSELWKSINALQGKRGINGIAIKTSNGISRDPKEIANILGGFFAKLSSRSGYNPDFTQLDDFSTTVESISIPRSRPGDRLDKPFSSAELSFALGNGKGKSAGPDDIGYPLLRHLPPIGKRVLLKNYNRIWEDRTFPDQWRHSLVIPIPKNDSNRTEPSGYRPISLTSCCGKVMERMVNRRLTQFIRDNDLLGHRQHAFRQGCGTNTYFATLGQVLDDALEKGLHVDLATLDLSKAYNRTWTPGVLRTLASWGISGNTFAFIRNFLTNRTFQVCIGNTKSNSFPEETGVPQGSVLAVTLFLIAMNGVFETLPKGVFIFVFADDIVILVAGHKPTLIRRKLQNAIKAVHDWALSIGFDLSPSKSHFSHICSGRHRTKKNPPTIDGEEIPFDATIRVLGLYLDRHLSFQPHCDRIKKQCESRLNLLRIITSKHTKNNRDVGLRVTKAIVCSRLLYGAELLCRNSENVISKLAPTYNRCIRSLSGLLPCTPATSTCVEAGIPPFRYIFAISVCSKAVSFLEKTSGDDGK